MLMLGDSENLGQNATTAIGISVIVVIVIGLISGVFLDIRRAYYVKRFRRYNQTSNETK
jgi:hypothetical protein